MVSVLSSDKKTVYQVTETSCTCADYMFRHAKVGSRCKHIIKHFFTFEDTNKVEFTEEIKTFFKNGADFDATYNQYGDKVDEWIKQSLICKSKHTGKSMFYLLE